MSYPNPVTPTSAPLDFDPQALKARVMRERCGFVTTQDVAQLAKHPTSRLWPLLVRCGGCRFLAAAQDVEHLCAIIAADRRDHVRDISFPTLENR